MSVRLMMGGLRPYTREVMSESMKKFLRKHWAEIQESTGQPFSFDLLKRIDFIYDTEVPSRALILANHLKPAIEWDFFKAIQHAFYAESKDTNELSTYLALAKKFGLPEKRFEELFQSEMLTEMTRAHFFQSREMGINAYPSVLLAHNERWFLLTRGYTSFETLDAKIQRALSQ